MWFIILFTPFEMSVNQIPSSCLGSKSIKSMHIVEEVHLDTWSYGGEVVKRLAHPKWLSWSLMVVNIWKHPDKLHTQVWTISCQNFPDIPWYMFIPSSVVPVAEFHKSRIMVGATAARGLNKLVTCCFACKNMYSNAVKSVQSYNLGIMIYIYIYIY